MLLTVVLIYLNIKPFGLSKNYRKIFQIPIYVLITILSHKQESFDVFSQGSTARKTSEIWCFKKQAASFFRTESTLLTHIYCLEGWTKFWPWPKCSNYSNISKVVQIYPKMPKLAQNCLAMDRTVKNRTKSHFYYCKLSEIFICLILSNLPIKM